MTILADPPIAAVAAAVPLEPQSTEPAIVERARRSDPTRIQARNCDCSSFFGRLLIWAMRNVER